MTGIFARSAPTLLEFGLAILPCDCQSKRPLISGFHRHRRAPAAHTVAKWALNFPSANIAVIPYLSGHAVVDVDDQAMLAPAIELFGETSLKVATKRGVHLWYRADGCNKPCDLRRSHGLAIEIVAGPGDYVIVPPSMHASGVPYSFLQGDWRQLALVPPLRVPAGLRTSPARLGPPKSQRRERAPEGKRAVTLNNLLCRDGPFCTTLEEVLEKAHAINHNLMEPPLSSDEVIRRATAVWHDVQTGKLIKMLGRASVVPTTAEEILAFAALGDIGSDAYFLLKFLQTQHSARVKRGETFALNTKAMEEQSSVPNWGRKRYATAIRSLLAAGYLIRVSDARLTPAGRFAAQYTLQ